ncbi:MAG: shikimate kinase [Chlorobium sp.]
MSLQIFLTGIGCVGKSTIGAIMADLLGIKFFDLDVEVEAFFQTSIERLQGRFFNMHGYRIEAAKALTHLLNRPESRESVIALPPSGLMGGYLKALKKNSGIKVAITDKPENIVERLKFYDIDSIPIEKELSPKEKNLHLRELKKDITYFGKTYKRADLQVDISGLDPVQAAHKIIEMIKLQPERDHQSSGNADVTLPDGEAV